MKNIEKYTDTKDALDAYNSLNIKKLPFDEWLLDASTKGGKQ